MCGSWGRSPEAPEGRLSQIRLRVWRGGSEAAAGASPRGGCAALRGGRAVQEANPRVGNEAADVRPREVRPVAPTSWAPEGSPHGGCTFPQRGSKARAHAVGRSRKVGRIFKGGERRGGWGEATTFAERMLSAALENRGPTKSVDFVGIGGAAE